MAGLLFSSYAFPRRPPPRSASLSSSLLSRPQSPPPPSPPPPAPPSLYLRLPSKLWLLLSQPDLARACLSSSSLLSRTQSPLPGPPPFRRGHLGSSSGCGSSSRFLAYPAAAWRAGTSGRGLGVWWLVLACLGLGSSRAWRTCSGRTPWATR
jgi:hypothetical protein